MKHPEYVARPVRLSPALDMLEKYPVFAHKLHIDSVALYVGSGANVSSPVPAGEDIESGEHPCYLFGQVPWGRKAASTELFG